MHYFALGLTLVGYLLLMLTNPVRSSLGDGWRCLRRYPIIWRTLAWFAFANAVFLLAVRFSGHLRGEESWTLMRPGWTDPGAWLFGTPDSIWWLPSGSVREAAENSMLPSLETTAGIFNSAVTTFPVAVFAALGLFCNRRGMFGVLRRAIWRRFGIGSWLVLPFVLCCALATVAKAFLYFRPSVVWIPDLWQAHWGPPIASASALFEYIFGVGVQAYLILHAYAWMRGLTFEPDAMRAVAIRRLGAAAKWAGIVLTAQVVLIELPLVLSFLVGWPAPPEVVNGYLPVMRFLLAAALLLFASMQAWLTLHGETLRRAWGAHWQLMWRQLWAVGWFIVLALVHCFLLQFARASLLEAFGEQTIPGILWAMIWPWIFGLIVGWLLASWVCLFKRCE